MVHLVLLGSTLRKASCNTGLLRACKKVIETQGHTADLIVPGDLPLFNSDLEQDNDHPQMKVVAAFRERVKAADALIFGVAEYNYSISGVQKNAVDWASRGPVSVNKNVSSLATRAVVSVSSHDFYALHFSSGRELVCWQACRHCRRRRRQR